MQKRATYIDQAEKGGIVPLKRILWDRVHLDNFGALILKIDVIRANSGAFGLVSMLKVSFSSNLTISPRNCLRTYQLLFRITTNDTRQGLWVNSLLLQLYLSLYSLAFMFRFKIYKKTFLISYSHGHLPIKAIKISSEKNSGADGDISTPF